MSVHQGLNNILPQAKEEDDAEERPFRIYDLEYLIGFIAGSPMLSILEEDRTALFTGGIFNLNRRRKILEKILNGTLVLSNIYQ